MDKTVKLNVSGRTAKIEYYDCVSSTNTLLKERTVPNTEEIEVIIADAQSGGRGRLGRTFFSNAKSGLYMSFRVKSNDVPNSENLTVIAALSVAEALEELTGKSFDIKWVNDIFCLSKKVCGILTEGVYDLSGELSFAVVGVGLNIAEPEGGYQDEIKNIAGYIFDRYTDDLRDALAIKILEKFFSNISLSVTDLYAAYKSRLCVLGCDVKVISHGVEYEAMAIDLCHDFALKVKKEDGTEIYLKSGEISIKI